MQKKHYLITIIIFNLLFLTEKWGQVLKYYILYCIIGIRSCLKIRLCLKIL